MPGTRRNPQSLSRHSMKALALLLCMASCLASFFISSVGQGLPILVGALKTPGLIGISTSHIIAFVWDERNFRFKRISLQFEKLNGHGSRDFTASRQAKVNLSLLHRFVIDEHMLAACNAECEASLVEGRGVAAVCGKNSLGITAKRVFRVTEPEAQTQFFLTDCDAPLAALESEPEVTLNLNKRTLLSESLRYVYSAKNHMLLDSFSLRDGTKETVLLSGSEMHLYGKPKFFFPLHFTGDDVRSRLVDEWVGPLGVAGQLSFFLDVLLFKITLNLRSEVSMYKDAIHVPVTLSLPVSGSMLRAGSGVVYGFKSPRGAEVLESVKTSLPRLGKVKPVSADTPLQSSGTFTLIEGSQCIAAGVTMPPELAALNFTPKLATRKELKALGFPDTDIDFGIFYDITLLKKGTNRFDVWFFTGPASDAVRLEKRARLGGAEVEIERVNLQEKMSKSQ